MDIEESKNVPFFVDVINERTLELCFKYKRQSKIVILYISAKNGFDLKNVSFRDFLSFCKHLGLQSKAGC